jgi:hypothetical protein
MVRQTRHAVKIGVVTDLSLSEKRRFSRKYRTRLPAIQQVGCPAGNLDAVKPFRLARGAKERQRELLTNVTR